MTTGEMYRTIVGCANAAVTVASELEKATGEPDCCADSVVAALTELVRIFNDGLTEEEKK